MIKGLMPALAEGGKIKIGGLGPERKSRSGTTFRPPVKLDHFVVTTTSRDENGDLIVDEALMAELPRDRDGKVRELPIVLHDDDIDQVFPTTYALYAGKKLQCRGDGEVATRYEIEGGQRTGRTVEINCPCDRLGAKSGPVCKPHGTLHCSIRVPGRAVAGVVHKWRTTSLISIQRMIGSLQQIRNICGTLCGIPLNLKLEAVNVSPPDSPASIVYCCHVELRAADIREVQVQAIESAKWRAQVRASSNYQALLAPPAFDETPEEEAEVAQEFHPETPADAAPEPEQIERVNGLLLELEERQQGSGRKALLETIGQGHLGGLTAAQLSEIERDVQQRLSMPVLQEPRRLNGNGDSIKETELRRMLAIARGAKHSEDDVRAWLRAEHGVDDLSRIPAESYDTICARLQSREPLIQGALA